jgi:site-specific recombinase XerC
VVPARVRYRLRFAAPSRRICEVGEERHALREGLAFATEGSRHARMAAYVESIRRAPRTLTEREQKALLRVTGEHRAGWRDHVLFAMALGTGLRAHELVALDAGDVFDDAGRVRRRLALRVFKGDGRGDDDRQDVLLSEGLRAKLEKLRSWKGREGESLDPDAPLFVSQRGTRLSTRQLRHAFAVWQERAGFERHVSLHMLRHSAISSIYASTKDIRLAQRFARHRSVVTTMVYTHPSDDDLARAVEQLRC